MTLSRKNKLRVRKPADIDVDSAGARVIVGRETRYDGCVRLLFIWLRKKHARAVDPPVHPAFVFIRL